MTIVKEEDGTMPVPDDDHTIFRNKLSKNEFINLVQSYASSKVFYSTPNP